MSVVAHPLTLPPTAPPLPLIYVDWNVVQYLRKDRALGPLLEALVLARCAKAAIVPYSIGHLLDATAGWTHLTADHRQERYRDMLFLEGLSLGRFWEIAPVSGGLRHEVSEEAVVEACDRRGLFSSIRGYREGDDGDGTVAAADARCRRDSAEGVDRIRATAASAQVPIPEEMVEAMISAMQQGFGDGLPEVTDSSSLMMSVIGPVLLAGATTFPSLGDVPPSEAVELIDKRLRSLGTSFAELLEQMLVAQPTLDADALGPGLLAILGYCPDSNRSVRQASPGFLADQQHGRCGLASAIFLTGERRLHRRTAAWASYTERGEQHGVWPVLLQVAPDDPGQISRAVKVVDAFREQFDGAAMRFFAT